MMTSARLAQPARTVQLSAYYDAAARDSQETDFGNFLSLPEDFHFAGPQRAVTLARLRRAVRNNPYLAGLVNHYPSAIGFSNLRSRTSSKAYNDAKELFWSRWAKRITRNGISLRSCEEIVLRELLIAGEIFIILGVDGRVQLVPSEYCGSSTDIGTRTSSADGTKEINGIIYDASDRPVSYRFGRMEATGFVTFSNAEVIPARNVIHVYQQDRVLMGRGLPWLLPSLRAAHDLHEITRSKTKQIKDANSISGTIESTSPTDVLGGMRSDEVPTPESPNAPADKVDTEPTVIQLKPGTFISLKTGEKLNMLKTQYQATDYKELVLLMLHAISSPVGLPVELWFSGLGDVAYSGFKGLGTQWNARRRYVLYFLEDRYLNRLQFWRISKAKNEGDIAVANPDGDEDLIDWAWRRTAVLDEEKEAKANALRLQSGEYSVADIWEEKGLYAEEVFAARRALWIRLELAAGNIAADADLSKVKVPREFLLRNALPGQNPYPYLPSGTGEPEDGATGKATKPVASDAGGNPSGNPETTGDAGD